MTECKQVFKYSIPIYFNVARFTFIRFPYSLHCHLQFYFGLYRNILLNVCTLCIRNEFMRLYQHAAVALDKMLNWLTHNTVRLKSPLSKWAIDTILYSCFVIFYSYLLRLRFVFGKSVQVINWQLAQLFKEKISSTSHLLGNFKPEIKSS